MGSKSGKKEEEKMQKSYLDVLGLCCTSEVKLVERILKNLAGVMDVQVALTTKTVIVLHDSHLISDFQIVKALNQAKLEASIKIKGAKAFKKKWPNPYAIGCGVLLCLSFLKYLWHPFEYLALGAVAIGIVPIAFRAFMAIKNFTLGDINILVVIAVAGSIALKDYWEAGTIVFLFTVAEWLESRASHKANAAMSSLANLVPQRAVLAGSGEEIKVDEVIVNTLLVVKEGEVIPIDGVVTEGTCEIDEKTLTGESFPVPKQIDSSVWAGTININGYVVIKTTTVAEDCVVAKMTKLVEEAQNNKSKTERYIETCAKYYTPAIIAISLGIAVIPVALRLHNLSRWYHLALVVLVSACPCALVLSTPVAMFCALIRAAAFGVFFKGGQYVEALANVNTIAFDKTGTITRGEFEVTEFKSLVDDDIDLKTLLYWVSSIERKSSHPLASAVVNYAESNSVEPNPQKVEGFQNFVGEGIYGEIDGKRIHIGNQKIANRAGCKTVPNVEGDIVQGKSIGYVFLGSKPAGIFCLSDICRTGVKEALKELKSMGIKTAMLTGDCQSAAEHVQDQLGGFLEVVHYELLPADKARIIQEFQKKGFTAMTGDGINDAPAMATADVGISMGISGSALAVETGDIILMTNDIKRIPEAIRLARGVKRKIIENICLSIVTKGAILGLAIAGHPLVWAAVLADVGTCLLVILNSMLLLRGMPNFGKKSTLSSASTPGTKCCKSSACSEGNEHKSHSTKKSHDHHHHHQESCCKDEKLQNSFDLQASSTNLLSCCPSDIEKGTSGCNGDQTISSNHGCCSNRSQEHHASTKKSHDDDEHHHQESCCNDDKLPNDTNLSSCCPSDIEKGTSECNGDHIHKTISSNHASNETGRHACSDDHGIHHKIESETTLQQAQTNHGCSSHTKHNAHSKCKTESETTPHQICQELAQTNHGCSSHTKHNAHSKCKTETETTTPHKICDEQGQTNHGCSSHTKHNAHSRCKIHASNTNVDDKRSDHHHHHHHHGGCEAAVKSSCCVQNGHLQDNNIRGGLSEIVVE